MIRNIIGVVVGYLAMFAFIFITFTLLFLILGVEGSFQSGTYDVSVVWIVASFILGLAAAVLGGFICVLISKNHNTALVLVGLVLVLGVVMAIPALGTSPNEVQEMRTGDVSNIEAMERAKQPMLVLLLNPLIGALGVFAGSKLKKEEI